MAGEQNIEAGASMPTPRSSAGDGAGAMEALG